MVEEEEPLAGAAVAVAVLVLVEGVVAAMEDLLEVEEVAKVA